MTLRNYSKRKAASKNSYAYVKGRLDENDSSISKINDTTGPYKICQDTLDQIINIQQEKLQENISFLDKEAIKNEISLLYGNYQRITYWKSKGLVEPNTELTKELKDALSALQK